MEDFKIIFGIAILDKRNDKSIVHPARFFLTETHGIWAEVWAQNEDGNLDDFLNENDKQFRQILVEYFKS